MSLLVAAAATAATQTGEAQFVVGPPVEISLGGQSEAAKVNDDGTIIGQVRLGGPERPRAIRDERARWHGFVKPADGPIINIDGTGVHSRPVASSRDGVVLANLGASNGQIYGSVFWSQALGQKPVTLPDVSGRISAVDMNDAGDAVFNTVSGAVYLWEKASAQFTRLLCPPDSYCQAQAINAGGAIVGMLDLTQPVIWHANMHDLSKLSMGDLDHVIPQDINAHGTIVGLVSPQQLPKVVVWRAPTYQLEVVADGAAYAINDQELIVGAKAPDAESAWTNRTACLWDLKRQRTIDLPGLDGKVAQGSAVDVNNAGVVVGTVEIDGASRTVRWGPYQPEE